MIAVHDHSEAIHKVEDSVASLTKTFERLKHEVCRNTRPVFDVVLAAWSGTLPAGQLPGLQSRGAASSCVET